MRAGTYYGADERGKEQGNKRKIAISRIKLLRAQN